MFHKASCIDLSVIFHTTRPFVENLDIMKQSLRLSSHTLNKMASAMEFPNIFPEDRSQQERCVITLSFAQSLDGSITKATGVQTRISDAESWRFTHYLRAQHDGILIGIETALIDDPRLTVRLVEGRQPRPIVLDSHLRIPETANLLQHPKQLWIFTTTTSCIKREETLQTRGARIIRVNADAQGRVSLDAVLSYLYKNEIRTVMVEGGSQVITSFMEGQHADYMVVTIAPVLMGGVNVLAQNNGGILPNLVNVEYHLCGKDIIVSGALTW